MSLKHAVANVGLNTEEKILYSTLWNVWTLLKTDKQKVEANHWVIGQPLFCCVPNASGALK